MKRDTQRRVLIVDDEAEIRDLLSLLVKEMGLKALVASDGKAALELLKEEPPAVAVVDQRMEGLNGLEVFKRMKEGHPELPVILMTAYPAVKQAVDAMREGALDYLVKPFSSSEFTEAVERALRESDRRVRCAELCREEYPNCSLRETMGPSSAIGHLLAAVGCVAASDFSVVILGETGSGKELVARAIHAGSPRSGGPFVAIDCGAIPETLLESELFGHEKGAFTGAESQKAGQFELARGGTLFLDEISNMPKPSQAKLLRVIQEKVLYRVGGVKPIRIDARIVVACNHDLQGCIASGAFRQDLYFRLNDFTITVPPLRERPEDIVFLARRFLDIASFELNKLVKGFSDKAVEALLAYRWPGNVRQLRSVVRRGILLADEVITEKELDFAWTLEAACGFSSSQEAWDKRSLKEIVQGNTMAVEREVLQRVLAQTGGNKAKAARYLQIDSKTLYAKMKRYGIWTNGESHHE